MSDNTNMENTLTEEEEKAHQTLVKLAADNGMYFVLWMGHFNNYFVGMRNASKKQPEVYGAMYEQFYDVKGPNDNMVFRVGLGLEKDWTGKHLPWQKMLQIAEESIAMTKSVPHAKEGEK